MNLVEWTAPVGQDIALQAVRIACAKEPSLHYEGFSISLSWEEKKKSLAERAAISRTRFKLLRTSLEDPSTSILHEVAWCLEWLKPIESIKTPQRRMGSYGYKHLVEDFAEVVGGKHVYICEGSFIAAAVGMGHDLVDRDIFRFGWKSVRHRVELVNDLAKGNNGIARRII